MRTFGYDLNHGTGWEADDRTRVMPSRSPNPFRFLPCLEGSFIKLSEKSHPHYQPHLVSKANASVLGKLPNFLRAHLTVICNHLARPCRRPRHFSSGSKHFFRKTLRPFEHRSFVFYGLGCLHQSALPEATRKRAW